MGYTTLRMGIRTGDFMIGVGVGMLEFVYRAFPRFWGV